MYNPTKKEKEKQLTMFLPKNLLSELDEIPFINKESVIYIFFNSFYR